MRKTEQRLWDRMRKHAAALAPKLRLERVENLVGVGMPDVLAIASGRVSWLELKSVDAYPVREFSRVLGATKGLSVAQRNWHYEWYAHSGKSFIVVGVGPADVFAIPGVLGDAINFMTRKDLQRQCVADSWATLFEQLDPFS